MRTISKFPRLLIFLTAGLLTGVASVSAQEPETKFGYVRLVEALAQGTGPVTLTIDGKNKNPDGYTLGDVTGGIGLKPGAHAVTIKREGVKDGTTTVNVVKDETTTLIPFAEKIPASDDKPAHWEIRILRLKQKEAQSERGAIFVSVSQEPEVRVELGTPDGNWVPGIVKRLTTTEMEVKEANGYVPLKVNGVKLPSMEVASKGNYVVVIYEDADGKIKSLNFRDIKFLTAD
jgi:hypothetical protein